MADQSIHPGVDGGRRVHAVVNTCTPSTQRGKPYCKIIGRYDQRIAAHAATLKSLPTNENPEAFRKPGSRNPRKLRKR